MSTYANKLLINQISNDILRILFSSFGLQFKRIKHKTDRLTRNYSLIFDKSKFPNLDEMYFGLTEQNGEFNMFIGCNEKPYLSIIDIKKLYTDDGEYGSNCTKEFCRTFLELYLKERTNQPQSLQLEFIEETLVQEAVEQVKIEHAPEGTFIKKIARIETLDQFNKCQIHFEDKSVYQIVLPLTTIDNINIGDYLHSQGEGNLMLIPKAQVQ